MFNFRKVKILIASLCDDRPDPTAESSDEFTRRHRKLLMKHQRVSHLLRNDETTSVVRCQGKVWEKVLRSAQEVKKRSSFFYHLRFFWEAHPVVIFRYAALAFSLIIVAGVVVQRFSVRRVAFSSSDIFLESDDMPSSVIPIDADETIIHLPETQEFTVIGTPVYTVNQ